MRCLTRTRESWDARRENTSALSLPSLPSVPPLAVCSTAFITRSSTLRMTAPTATTSSQNPPAVGQCASPLSGDAEANFLFRLARNPTACEDIPSVGPIANWQRLLQVASNANAIIALREH